MMMGEEKLKKWVKKWKRKWARKWERKWVKEVEEEVGEEVGEEMFEKVVQELFEKVVEEVGERRPENAKSVDTVQTARINKGRNWSRERKEWKKTGCAGGRWVMGRKMGDGEEDG